MSWELDRHQWNTLRAAGTAVDVPLAIEALQSATTEEAAVDAYWRIDNVVVVQGAVYEAALAATQCLLSSLLQCTEVARPHILELLVQIGSGEASESEVVAGNSSVVEMCLGELVRGFPIYAHLLEHSSRTEERAYCVDLLCLCARHQAADHDRVVWYLRRVMTGEAPGELKRLVENWLQELAFVN